MAKNRDYSFITSRGTRNIDYDEGVKAGKLEVLQELMDELSKMSYQGGMEEGDPTVVDWEDIKALINSKIEAISGKDDK